MRALLLIFVLGFSLSASAFENPFAKKQKEWTILVFLNGHNNLDIFGKEDVNEMEAVGSTKDVNVVVQWASLENKTTKRLYINKDSDPENVTSKVVMDMARVDMGNYKNLADFIIWGAKKYPSKKLAVIVWNHGSGWHLQTMGTKDISHDEISEHRITTVQQGLALDIAANALGRKIDILGNDACLMAMPEVTFQLKNSVNYFVGSEQTEPGDGWPYTEVLGALTRNPELNSADFSKIIVDEYVKSYSEGGSAKRSEVTLAAYSLTEANIYGLAVAVRELGQSIFMLSPKDKIKVRTAMNRTLAFADPDYADLVDFANKLEAQGIESTSLSKSIAYVKAAAESFVIAKGSTKRMANAHGLSIWLPTNRFDYIKYIARYPALDFNKMTGWATAIQSVQSLVPDYLPTLPAFDFPPTNPGDDGHTAN